MSTSVTCTGSDYTFTADLDASGNTTDYLTGIGNRRYHSLQFSHTGTPTSWVIRIEGSEDGSVWAGIDPSGNNNSADYSGNLTFTTARPKIVRFVGKYNYIRVFQVSYASTTHSTISTTVKYSGG